MCCGRCVCCDQTPVCKCAFVPGALIPERRTWDDVQSQLDDVARHLQLLRPRVSLLSSACAQFLADSKATQRQQ